jgi:hypothetical protein
MKPYVLALAALLLSGGSKKPSASLPLVHIISTRLPTPEKTEVKIYIPSHLLSGGAAKDLVLFLHGDNLTPKPLDAIVERHQLKAQIGKMAQAGRRKNSVWVVPYSTGKCDHFNELFSSPTKSKAFFDAVIDQIRKQGVSISQEPTLVLSGQSRARMPLRKLLTLQDKGELMYWGQVDEVYLFDALYDSAEIFADFAKQPGTRFWTAYGTSTSKGAQRVYQLLEGNTDKGIYSDLPLGERGAPKIKKATPNVRLSAQDKSNPIGFVSSPVEHKFTARTYAAALMS